jgi:hypothetical protein
VGIAQHGQTSAPQRGNSRAQAAHTAHPSLAGQPHRQQSGGKNALSADTTRRSHDEGNDDLRATPYLTRFYPLNENSRSSFKHPDHFQ